MADESPAQEQELTLALSEDGRKLLASALPGSVKPPFDLAALKQEIDAQGFGQLFLIDSALNQLVKQYATASEPFTLEIGEVRDAIVAVDLAPDKMTAWISVTPPCGGAAVSAEQIRRALADKQLTCGILDDVIRGNRGGGGSSAPTGRRGARRSQRRRWEIAMPDRNGQGTSSPSR